MPQPEGKATEDAVTRWTWPHGPTVLISAFSCRGGRGQKNSCPTLLPLLPAALYLSRVSGAARDEIETVFPLSGSLFSQLLIACAVFEADIVDVVSGLCTNQPG